MPGRSCLVAERCGKVAQWAIGRATAETRAGEIESLMALAAQAKVLGELAGSQGKTISQPQLARLLEAAREGGQSLRPMTMAAGGPLLVRSLAELSTEQTVFVVSFVDVWAVEGKSEQYGIKSIPTQLFFDKDGKELFRHVGFYPKEDILVKWKAFGIE